MNLPDFESLDVFEADIFSQHFYFSFSCSADSFFESTTPLVLKVTSHPISHPCIFDLSKEPSSAYEALARPDAHVWHAAME